MLNSTECTHVAEQCLKCGLISKSLELSRSQHACHAAISSKLSIYLFLELSVIKGGTVVVVVVVVVVAAKITSN